MDDAVDLDHLRGWIGQSETATDIITPRLLHEYAATMDTEPEPGLAPLAAHWCLAPPAVKASSLGPDGHPAHGGFLPPIPLPRRMWAGSRLKLHERLRVGDTVTRTSRLADITVKQGRAGTLCFVTVAHDISTPRGLALTEQQDIVFLPFGPQAARKPAAPAPSEWQQPVVADPVTLFRYSALTFNGHRIHYDRPYAMGTESYPGLVVHGPLQASWLLDFAAKCHGSPPASFSFRGLSPLFDFDHFALHAAPAPTGGLTLWIATSEGVRSMEASAQW